MMIKYKIGIGDYAQNSFRSYVCIYADIEKLIFISLENNESLSSGAIALHIYILNNDSAIKELNTLFDETSTKSQTYNVINGSKILQGNKEMLLIGLHRLKIVTTEMDRPLLFDFESAGKYTLKEVLNNDFTVKYTDRDYVNYYKRFFEYVFSSKEKTDLKVLKSYTKPLKIVTPSILANLKPITFEEAVSYAPKLFAMPNLEKIKNPKLKSKLKDLVLKTIEIGIENDQIGITEKYYNEGFVIFYKDKNGNQIDFENFEVDGNKYNQVITESGKTGFYDRSIDKIYTEPYFIRKILKNNTYFDMNVPYVEIDNSNNPKSHSKPSKNTDSKKGTTFEDLIESGLDELSAEELIDEGLEELN